MANISFIVFLRVFNYYADYMCDDDADISK